MFESRLTDAIAEARRRYGPPSGRIPGSWYDADYYDNPGRKSNIELPYSWKNYRNQFKSLAEFLLFGFPQIRSMIDVGCAKGFLLSAMLDHVRPLSFGVEVFGFDHSSYAIENADDQVRGFVECASVDDFVFRRNFDLMTAFDVFEHITEEQSATFLGRSREHVNMAIFTVIPDGGESIDFDLSHVNMKPRAYWNELFAGSGWIIDDETMEMVEMAKAEQMVKLMRWVPYVFKARRY